MRHGVGVGWTAWGAVYSPNGRQTISIKNKKIIKKTKKKQFTGKNENGKITFHKGHLMSFTLEKRKITFQ